MSTNYSESTQFASPCMECITSAHELMTLQQYLNTGIHIWFIKVAVSFFISSPSTRPAVLIQQQELCDILIYMVFFSPNIIFWPLNIALDIYTLVAELGTHYSIDQILFIIVGF